MGGDNGQRQLKKHCSFLPICFSYRRKDQKPSKAVTHFAERTAECSTEAKKMESNPVKMKKIYSIHGYGFLELVRVLREGCVCVCIASLLISCAPTVPKQTYLTNTSLSGISKVAVVVSSSAPKVSYSVNSPGDSPPGAFGRVLDKWGWLGWFGLIFPVITVVEAGTMTVAVVSMAVQSGKDSAQDSAQAEKVGKRVNPGYVEPIGPIIYPAN